MFFGIKFKLRLIVFTLLSTFLLNTNVFGKTLLGIDVLRNSEYSVLVGKRVGLLTHPAGVDSNGTPTVEILYKEKKVDLVALFGPEHGIYGNEKANQPIDNQIDPKTGLPVFSLYGKYRTPTQSMLNGLDVMVIDLQDIGVRSYTYISCMRLTLEACFKNNVEVVILDRPNPLGGIKVDGPLMEKNWRSYVGAFMVPYLHGLTIGELATIAKETPNWLDIEGDLRRKSKMTVIHMENWERKMTWNQTGLQWIPTSPTIPTLAAVLGYAMVGLGAEINGFRHGYGTQFPFRLLSHRDISSKKLLSNLQALNVKGVGFSIEKGFTKSGSEIEGVYVHLKDWKTVSPTELSFRMMPLSCTLEGTNSYKLASKNRAGLFNKHVGSQLWWDELSKKGSKVDVDQFIERWKAESTAFSAWSSIYWLYQ